MSGFQGLHWQEDGVWGQRVELSPVTLKWDAGILTIRTKARSAFLDTTDNSDHDREGWLKVRSPISEEEPE